MRIALTHRYRRTPHADDWDIFSISRILPFQRVTGFPQPFDASADVTSAPKASTRTYFGVADLSALRISAW
jgi:hypothetical protein